jgi:hypothetical protein
MAGLLPDYPAPILLCSSVAGNGLQPNILDIGAFATPGYPPVLQIVISNAATVQVFGALQVSQTNPATLIDSVDLSAGGFTASDFYDIIPGIRFYQIYINNNTGTVTVKAGVGPQLPGHVGLPQLLRLTNNAPQGT